MPQEFYFAVAPYSHS